MLSYVLGCMTGYGSRTGSYLGEVQAVERRAAVVSGRRSRRPALAVRRVAAELWVHA